MSTHLSHIPPATLAKETNLQSVLGSFGSFYHWRRYFSEIRLCLNFLPSFLRIFLHRWQSEEAELCLSPLLGSTDSHKIRAGNVTDFGWLGRQIFHPVSSSPLEEEGNLTKLTDRWPPAYSRAISNQSQGLRGDVKSSKYFVYNSQ